MKINNEFYIKEFQEEIEDLRIAIKILKESSYSLGLEDIYTRRIPNKYIGDFIQLKEAHQRRINSKFKIHQAETNISEILANLIN